MNRRRILIPAMAAALLIAGIGVAYFLRRPTPLPRFTLRDGAEFHVIQITYTNRPSDSVDHNIGANRPLWAVYHHLPWFLQRWFNPPNIGIGNQGSQFPAVSIWWGRLNPTRHQYEIGPAGDVIMTLDSGAKINLGWPDPANDETADGPEYRQIFITPPSDSRYLTFDVPTEDEVVQFTIENPAYQP